MRCRLVQPPAPFFTLVATNESNPRPHADVLLIRINVARL